MNRIKKKMIGIILLAWSMTMAGGNAQINKSQLSTMVLKDDTLIVPGVGAASILIDMPEEEMVLIKGKPFEKTQNVTHDFFKDVLRIKSEIRLPFNYLYTYRNPFVIIGFQNKRVSFVTVWGSYGVLIDGVKVSGGVMKIIFNYGNEGLSVIKDADNSIFMYPLKGIAFVDEKNDDAVDGTIIFKGVLNK